MILRHGKPAAAIVPVAAALPPKRRRARAQSLKGIQRSVQAFVDEFSAAEPKTSAVEDLRRGRPDREIMQRASLVGARTLEP